jgi:hypothetical protein
MKENSSGRQKPMKVAVSPDFGHRETRDTCREQNPEAETLESTARGYEVRKNTRLCKWKSSLKGSNPTDGTGMKQGRQRAGGSRPREREKR